MNIPEEIVEQAAQAAWAEDNGTLHTSWEEDFSETRAAYRNLARAALSAAWNAMEPESLVTYYRSLTPDGKLWCESRSAEEVREMSEGMECTFEVLRSYKVTGGWEEWK